MDKSVEFGLMVDKVQALVIEREARAAGEQKAIEYSIKLQRLIENLKYDTDTPYPELHHHKMIVAAKARILDLETALRKKGHAPNCDLDPCDCGLDAVLTPAKTAEPTGTDSKCPHGHWKAYCDLCLLATAEREVSK